MGRDVGGSFIRACVAWLNAIMHVWVIQVLERVDCARAALVVRHRNYQSLVDPRGTETLSDISSRSPTVLRGGR